jgi:hypothetical protein
MHFTLLSWVAPVFIPYVAVVVLYLPRIMRRSPRDVAALRWMFSQAAWFVAWAAALSGGPQWILSVGSIVCLILMHLALREARRSPKKDDAPVPARPDPSTGVFVLLGL